MTWFLAGMLCGAALSDILRRLKRAAVEHVFRGRG